MAIDIYQKVRGTALWPVITASSKYYLVNAILREYHNHHHACMVVQYVNLLTEYNPSNELLIAAEWHDAVYFPGAGGAANEACSAAALGIESRSINSQVELTTEQKNAINNAQTLIQHTSVEVHLRCDHEAIKPGRDLAILLDADLASLAVDKYSNFLYNQECIIRENGGIVNDETYKRCAEFLVKFLQCREYIYSTEMGRQLWESKARENIKYFCFQYGVPVLEE